MRANTRYIVAGPLVLVAALAVMLAISAPALGATGYTYGIGGLTDLVDDASDELEETVDGLLDDPTDVVGDAADEVGNTIDEAASALTGDDDGDDDGDGDRDRSGSDGSSDEEDGSAVALPDPAPDTRAAAAARQATTAAATHALRFGDATSSLPGFRLPTPTADQTTMSSPPLDDVLAPVTRDTSEDGDDTLLTADRQSIQAVPDTSSPSAIGFIIGGALILLLMATAWLAGLRPPEDVSDAT